MRWAVAFPTGFSERALIAVASVTTVLLFLYFAFEPQVAV
jgi:hypothetical protein